MSHEQSITVERNGRYFVLDNAGPNKGKHLGPAKGFATEAEANEYAKARSDNFGQAPPRPADDSGY